MENKWITSQDIMSTDFHKMTEQEHAHVLDMISKKYLWSIYDRRRYRLELS